jgi:hypothetical protein
LELKFKSFDLGSAKRWKKFVESEAPEKEKFPQEWKSKTSLQKLCLMRALRPDRMLYALSLFVEEKLGRKYVENRTIECNYFSRIFDENIHSIEFQLHGHMKKQQKQLRSFSFFHLVLIH